jgi:glycosyltransferase involved in cell wall biosynthesis
VLVPRGDVRAMAARALELLGDPARLQAARAAGLQVAARFSADRIVPMYEELYQRVLAR